MNVKIEPYSGGASVVCLPLQRNIPHPQRADWKLVVCAKCGAECWESDLTRETMKTFPELTALCTECALRQGMGGRDCE